MHNVFFVVALLVCCLLSWVKGSTFWDNPFVSLTSRPWFQANLVICALLVLLIVGHHVPVLQKASICCLRLLSLATLFYCGWLFVPSTLRVVGMSEGLSEALPDLGNSIVAVLLFCSLGFSWAIVEQHPVSVEGQRTKGCERLVVVFHGLTGKDNMKAVEDAIQQVHEGKDKADVMTVEYQSGRWTSWFSNSNPLEITAEIDRKLAKACSDNTYKHVTLVGYSMGALLLRKAYLHAHGQCSDEELAADPPTSPSPWAENVDRIVLLAGVNRGVDIAGHRPSDMSRAKHFGMWFGTWFGDLLEIGKLARSVESGSKFVANLRMDWIKFFRNGGRSGKPVTVFQMLGDIDDLVSPEDDSEFESLDRASDRLTFVPIRLRGTAHADLVDMKPPEVQKPSENEEATPNWTPENYRLEWFRHALTADVPPPEQDGIAASAQASDEGNDDQNNEDAKPPVTEPVTDVLFVIHGIRDFGRWSAEFESALEPHRNWAIVSPRYGYFGMGPFLLASRRQSYVQWLMDEITEARVQYPDARLHFFGHSNGTYLLAKGLQDYRSLDVKRVVFAGSVVSTDYPWPKGRVEHVLNLTANNDWVVALFPRLFQQVPLRFLPGGPVGGAGFFGFENLNGPGTPGEGNADLVSGKNVKLCGQHSAFDGSISAITAHFTGESPEQSGLVESDDAKDNNFTSFLNPWIVPPLVMCALIAVVLLVGFWLVIPARQYSIPVGLCYLLVVLWVLHRV